MLHENNNYVVMLNDDVTGYLVQNKNTLVPEYETTMLPDAIKIAGLLNEHLEQIKDNKNEPVIKAINFSELIN